MPLPRTPDPTAKVVKNGLKGTTQRFRYAKGGNYTSNKNPNVHDSKRHKSNTQKTGCPFKLTAKPLPDGHSNAGASRGSREAGPRQAGQRGIKKAGRRGVAAAVNGASGTRRLTEAGCEGEESTG